MGPPHESSGGERARRGQTSRRQAARSSRPERPNKPRRPQAPNEHPSRNRKSTRQLAHLSDDVVGELKATARPGKAAILVQVFAEAVTAFGEENMDEAIRLGDQAKHIALRSSSVREMLGLAYYRNTEFKEAARELSAFRRLAGSAEQNPVIADCYRAMSKPERAVELCDEVGDSAPDAVRYEGAIVAAGALTDMGRVDDAIARIETLDLDPPNVADHHLRAWYVLADLLERRGRFTQSLSFFEAVAAADAESTDAPERARRLKRR